MKKFDLPPSASPDDVVQVVKDFGIARIPAYSPGKSRLVVRGHSW